MYAKLVVGGSAIQAIAAIRDIGRLLVATEGNINTSLLGAFSTASSVIIDPTPAGWTYVGSTLATDRPSIAAPSTTYTTTNATNNLCFSAPCLEGSALKYAVLSQQTIITGTVTSTSYFALTGAVSATSLGVLTNEGGRQYGGTTASAGNMSGNLRLNAGDIIYVIANQRGITIVGENRGMSAVWECSMTDVNRFYGTAPMIQYTHNTSSLTTFVAYTAPFAQSADAGAWANSFAVTDVNTGTYYGSYDSTSAGSGNAFFLIQNDVNYRKNSIDAAGSPKYQITPVLFSNSWIGHPIQYVTGVVPIYWTKAALGNTGDTVMVGTEAYTFFNCGTGFGVIMKTS